MTSSSDNGLSEENRALVEQFFKDGAPTAAPTGEMFGRLNSLLNAARASSIPPGVWGTIPAAAVGVMALVAQGVPPDIIEMLVRGNPAMNVRPGALAAAMTDMLAALGNKGREGANKASETFMERVARQANEPELVRPEWDDDEGREGRREGAEED